MSRESRWPGLGGRWEVPEGSLTGGQSLHLGLGSPPHRNPFLDSRGPLPNPYPVFLELKRKRASPLLVASVKPPPLPLFLRCHHAANRAFPGVLTTSPFLVLFQLRPRRPVLRIAVTSRPSPELRPLGGPGNCDPGWRVREGTGRRGPATVPPNIHYRCRLRDLQAAAARCQKSSRRLPAGAFLPIELRVAGRQ